MYNVRASRFQLLGAAQPEPNNMLRVSLLCLLIAGVVALEIHFNSCVTSDSLRVWCSNGYDSCSVYSLYSVNCSSTEYTCEAAIQSSRTRSGVNYVNTYAYFDGAMSVLDADNDDEVCDLIGYSNGKYTFSCDDFASCDGNDVYVYL